MEHVNLENMSAQAFYEKSLANQRELVNVAIVAGMQNGSSIIKLATQLYEKISHELCELGWEERIVQHKMYKDDGEGVSWIYPVCMDGISSLPGLTTEKGKIIPAVKFYEATLKNQKRDLSSALNGSIALGVSEVKLKYMAYPELVSEMEKEGWEHVIWYDNPETQEECSLFYPTCGYLDPEEEG